MKVALLLVLFALSVSLPAQEIDLADRRPQWSVGVAAFHGRNLSSENLYLTRSFPLLLRERLEAIPEHTFSEEEVRAYRERIIRKERRRLIRELSAARRDRDELFFASASAHENAAGYEERIESYLTALDTLEETVPEEIAFPRSKPLRFVSGAEGQLVFDREVLSPFQLARQQDLDVLLWGRLEEIQGFLYFEITVFHAILGEPIFTYSDAGIPAELYELSDDLIPELATVLWGRDWSALTVRSEPPGASVWIDEVFQGRTPLNIPYVLPGSREIRLQAPGYRPILRTVELPPYTEEVQSFSLVEQDGEIFSLHSDPPGAAVYLGSEWLGTTPLGVEEPEVLSRFLLRRGGYLDFPLYVHPAPGDSISVDLVPESLDPAEIQQQRRDELYRAFAAFALSIPFPVFLGGYRSDYLALGKDASALTYAYAATFTASTILFVNLAVRVIRYLRAADRKA